MVAAVAFSGVLTTTQTAEAAVQSRSAEGAFVALPTGNNVSNGQTVYVQNDATGYVTFEISTVKGAKASFTHADATDNGQKIVCKASARAGTCDADTSDPGVTVALKVANDSTTGGILVKHTVAASPATPTIDEINVAVAQVATKLTVTPTTKAINASAAGDAVNNTTTITIRLTDSNAKGVGGKALSVTASHGTLSSGARPTPDWAGAASGGTVFTGGTQAGSITTTADDDASDTDDGAGYASVTLTGAGASGTSKVTVSLPNTDVSTTAEVVLYGAANKISATVSPSAITVGEDTWIVVDVTDASSNPVARASVDVAATLAGAATAITGPSALAVKVDADNDIDFIHPTNAKLNLPACGDFTTDDPDTNDVNEATRFPAGTNAAGKCVIKINATGGATPTNPADDAARGTHTVTLAAASLAANSAKNFNVEIQVGGPPNSITHNAPSRVDSLSESTITVTVWDDNDVRVGAVPIRIDKVEGAGLVTSGATSLDTDPNTPGNQPTKTLDGKHSFTYLASRDGTVVFRVSVGSGATAKVSLIEFNIGPAPVEEPQAPPATWSADLVAGTHNIVWNGNDGADPSAGAADGVVAIWQWNGSGWDGYFPEASEVPGGNTLDSLSSGAAYWVIVE